MQGGEPIRGPQTQKATIMSVPPEDDGRAAARTRFRIFTRRPRAGRRTGRAFQSLLAAGALAALGVSAGADSASAATARPAGPPITGVTWHQLTLINGWVSSQSQSPGDGIPAWTVRSGVVYLTGSVMQTSGTNGEFAVLPQAARPTHVLYMPVSVLGQGTHGWIIVYPSGAMYAMGNPYSAAQGFTGLAGISYPAKAMAMSTLSLENGWQSSDAQYGTGDPSYSVKNGVVHLSGSLVQPPAPGDTQDFAILPAAARPKYCLYIKTEVSPPDSFAAAGQIVVCSDGRLFSDSYPVSESEAFTSLAGISYPVGS